VSNGHAHLTTVSEKDLVLVPPASAEPLLRAFFALHPEFERVHQPDRITPCYAIHWESEGGGPYPVFDGELMVDADENFNGFWIVLTGRIARSTARTLLREMRVEIEALYQAGIQRKAS
jgi:hypothetical protein